MGFYKGQGRKYSIRIDCKEWVAGSGYNRLHEKEKGHLMLLMCMLIQCESPGILKKPKSNLLRLSGNSKSSLDAIIESGLVVGSDTRLELPVQTQTHRGEWITLVHPQDGPIWIVPKLVEDEHQRKLSAKWMVSEANKSRRDKRLRIFAKTDGHCYHCGAVLNPEGGWHIDHLIPTARGGSENDDNLFPACPPCNMEKSDSMPGEWTPPKYRKAAGVFNG